MPAFRWLIVEPDPALRRLLVWALGEELPKELAKEIEMIAPEVIDVEELLLAADEQGGQRFDFIAISGKGVPVEELLPALDKGLEGYAVVVSTSVDPTIYELLRDLQRPIASVPKCPDIRGVAKAIIAAYYRAVES